jgi:hypothetical protein
MALHAEASTTSSPSGSTSGRAARTSRPGSASSSASRGPAEGHLRDRRRRQVRAPARLLQVAPRGRSSTAGSPTTAASTSSTSTASSSTPERRARASRLDAILVPGGFGERGTEGKIEAIRYAREKGDPLLRHLPRHAARGHRVRPHVCGIAGANSTEFDAEAPQPGHRPDARSARRARQGRHDAPRRVPLRARPAPSPPRPTAPPRSPSATATATSSTTLPRAARRGRPRALGHLPRWTRLVEMVELPRSTRTSSAASSTPSSRADHRIAPRH